MAQQRKVRRATPSGRQGPIQSYQAGSSWLMPPWARQFAVQNMGWVDLILTIILTPVAILGLVLSINSLPLQVLGHPANDTSIGISVGVLLLQFALMALAIRPLFDKRLRGWNLLAVATVVHVVYDVLQQQTLRGLIILALAAYVLLQIRRYYHE